MNTEKMVIMSAKIHQTSFASFVDSTLSSRKEKEYLKKFEMRISFILDVLYIKISPGIHNCFGYHERLPLSLDRMKIKHSCHLQYSFQHKRKSKKLSYFV